jgi:RluA family pseudouridine synthase
VAKTDYIEPPGGECVAILYEDRSVLAIDKPPGWVVEAGDDAPTLQQLQLGVREGIQRGWFWARCRNLKFLRFVHRLDLPTTGILLGVKSAGGVGPYSKLFSDRGVTKRYVAVVEGAPTRMEWACDEPLAPHPTQHGKHHVDRRLGKDAFTEFKVLAQSEGRALIEAAPRTGRTHQIRLHLLASGYPVVGDALYGRPEPDGMLALRAVGLSYKDPFTQRVIRIRAPMEEFLRRFGFSGAVDERPPRPSTPSSAPHPSKDQKGRKSSSPSSAERLPATKASSSSPAEH